LIKKFFFFLIVIGLSFSLVSCDNSDELISTSYPAESSGSNPSLDNEFDATSAYPSYPVESSPSDSSNNDENADSITNKEIIIPTPKANSMVIHGKLLSKETNQILPDIELKLGTIIPVNPGPGYIVSTNESSPRTHTNFRGEFLFDDVGPNDYVLILNTPFNSYPVFSNNDEQIEIYEEVGNLIELGTVYVYWP
jgi:hypothetical protein